MTKRLRLLLFVLPAHTIASSVNAAEVTIGCPASLPADTVQITRVPSGWQGFTATLIPLHAAGITDGPASSRATLVPDRTARRDKISIVSWNLRDIRHPWLSCEYGDGNELVLSKPLPVGLHECSVTYTKQAPPEFDKIAVRCQR